MEYNTSLDKLVMPEYGRNIQEMVRHALTIEDRDLRTRCAYTIASVMITLFPKLKDDANYKQKVWDHIAMMADFKLDVDAPYPLPTAQEAATPVEKHVPYPMTKIHLRQYGQYVESMIREALSIEDPQDRLQVVAQVALYMKQVLLQNGKDSNIEDRVCADIYDMSNGALSYDFAEFQQAVPREQRGAQRSWQAQQKQQWQARGNSGGRFQNNRSGGRGGYNNNNNGGGNYGNNRQQGRRYKKY